MALLVGVGTLSSLDSPISPSPSNVFACLFTDVFGMVAPIADESPKQTLSFGSKKLLPIKNAIAGSLFCSGSAGSKCSQFGNADCAISHQRTAFDAFNARFLRRAALDKWLAILLAKISAMRGGKASPIIDAILVGGVSRENL